MQRTKRENIERCDLHLSILLFINNHLPQRSADRISHFLFFDERGRVQISSKNSALGSLHWKGSSCYPSSQCTQSASPQRNTPLTLLSALISNSSTSTDPFIDYRCFVTLASCSSNFLYHPSLTQTFSHLFDALFWRQRRQYPRRWHPRPWPRKESLLPNNRVVSSTNHRWWVMDWID